jgi:hypothetical protein
MIELTYQERFRKSFRYWLLHHIWVKANRISRWAGKRIVNGSCTADARDWKIYEKSKS